MNSEKKNKDKHCKMKVYLMFLYIIHFLLNVFAFNWPERLG